LGPGAAFIPDQDQSTSRQRTVLLEAEVQHRVQLDEVGGCTFDRVWHVEEADADHGHGDVRVLARPGGEALLEDLAGRSDLPRERAARAHAGRVRDLGLHVVLPIRQGHAEVTVQRALEVGHRDVRQLEGGQLRRCDPMVFGEAVGDGQGDQGIDRGRLRGEVHLARILVCAGLHRPAQALAVRHIIDDLAGGIAAAGCHGGHQGGQEQQQGSARRQFLPMIMKM
jgi:hypothetical protein